MMQQHDRKRSVEQDLARELQVPSGGLGSIPGRNHRPHVIGQFAVTLAEAQI
jgi:hypothetical protein